MKIAFMGTPDFAATCLASLAVSEHEIVGVFCQPDKPVGRKQELKMPDVKIEALKHDLKVYQPNTLRNGAGVEILKEIQPDLVIVVAYGKLLPKDFLEYPKYGCINVHASILPKYRGASPIHWSVINGDKTTGVTVMQMDEGLDTGDILLCKTCDIDINDTTELMYEKLAPLGAQAMLETVSLIEQGKLNSVKQDDSKATKVGLLSKDMSPIDWNDTALNIHNKIRGLYSWPCTSSTVNEKKVKIYLSRLSSQTSSAKPGTVVDADKKIVVCCGDGNCIEITELQLEGKKRMKAKDLLNGFKIEKGNVFE